MAQRRLTIAPASSSIADYWTTKKTGMPVEKDIDISDDDDNTVVIPGKQCCHCDAPATDASPSGHSFYCSRHGRCIRCSARASEMVWWESREIFVCPCVIEEDRHRVARGNVSQQ